MHDHIRLGGYHTLGEGGLIFILHRVDRRAFNSVKMKWKCTLYYYHTIFGFCHDSLNFSGIRSGKTLLVKHNSHNLQVSDEIPGGEIPNYENVTAACKPDRDFGDAYGSASGWGRLEDGKIPKIARDPISN